MADAATPNDAPRRDPDPRGPFGAAHPGDGGSVKGSLPREPVVDHPNTDTIRPEDHSAKDRAASAPD